MEAVLDVVRAHADAAEAARRLPEPVVAALRDGGLLRMAAPDPGLPPGDALRRAEAVARVDASAGWCVSIHVTSSLLLGYLRDDVPGVLAGVWAPRGTGVPDGDGLRVSGRWAFCSGITHADTLFAGCLVDGAPRIVALPVGDLEIVDTWDTVGLRATGSHDAVADAVRVPSDRVIALADGPVVDAPLYRFPVFGYFAGSIAAAALGNARGALDDLVALAARKTAPGASRTLADRSATQAAVGAAEASLRAARAFFFEAVGTAWDAAQAGPVGLDARRDLRLAATHAVRTSAEVVRSLHDLGGGTAVYAASPLARRFRDAHTATAHVQVNAGTLALAGRLLLGLEADTRTL